MGRIIISTKKLQKKTEGHACIIKKETVRSKIQELLNYKGANAVLFAIAFFGTLYLFAGYKGGDTECEECRKSHVRSELLLPAESVFLRRPIIAKKIKDHFSQYVVNRPVISVLGLAGVSGSGKTTLARAYGKTLSNTSVVWEINAETRDTIIASFKNLAHALAHTKKSKSELFDIECIQDADDMIKKIVDFVAIRLKQCPNWLLIYDNVESFSDLDNFFPCDVNIYGAGKVIITTRNQTAGKLECLDAGSVISVDALTTSEMLTLFTKMTYNTEAYVFSREKEKKLIQFLSNIPPYPLDVSVVSYYIKNSHITCEAYLEQMRQNESAAKNAQVTFVKGSNAYAHARYNIIAISIKQLVDAEPEFKSLLMLLSLVSAEDIPKALFESYKDPILIKRFLFLLEKYAFITGRVSSKRNKEKTFSIHRSTQKIMREVLFSSNEKGDADNEILAFKNVIQKFSEKRAFKEVCKNA